MSTSRALATRADSVELSERNLMLSLLRQINEIMLLNLSHTSSVARDITDTVCSDESISFIGLFKLEPRNKVYAPLAVSRRVDRQSTQVVGTDLEDWNLNIKTSPSLGRFKHRVSIVILSKEEAFDQVPELRGCLRQIALTTKVNTICLCPLSSREGNVGLMVVGLHELKDKINIYRLEFISSMTATIGMAINNSLLQDATHEYTSRLKRANQRLHELDNAKDNFLSMASHQLRTPLTSIKGFLSMVLEGDLGKINPRQQEFLSDAYVSTDRMVNLIGDLLNISRMSANRFFIDWSLVDVVELVKHELGNLQITANSRKISLVLKTPEQPLPLTYMDSGKTKQVIMNIIDNAIYYTKKGTVTVTIGYERGHIVVKVKDPGIGIPHKEQSNVFNKFYRSDNAKHMRPDGTGLGLFLAKRIIEEQGGTMIFSSIEGHGSTFGFRIPVRTTLPGEEEFQRP